LAAISFTWRGRTFDFGIVNSRKTLESHPVTLKFRYAIPAGLVN